MLPAKTQKLVEKTQTEYNEELLGIFPHLNPFFTQNIKQVPASGNVNFKERFYMF